MPRKKIFRLTIWMLLASGCGRPLELQDRASFVDPRVAGMTSGPRDLSREVHPRPPRTAPPDEPESPPQEQPPQEQPPKPTPPETDPSPAEPSPPARETPPAVVTPTPEPKPAAPAKPGAAKPQAASLRLAGIEWKGVGRPTLDGKPAPLGLLPYWYDYPWRRVTTPEKWTAWLLEDFGAFREFTEGAPKDITRFCPRYGSLDSDERKLFWLRFFSVLVEMESAFNPTIVVHDVQVGPKIYSSGLLQLSLESAKWPPYGCTMIRQQSDLVDARKNLACGVRILGYYLRKDGLAAGFKDGGAYWLGGSRYWAPLRHAHLRSPAGRSKLEAWITNSRPVWIRGGMAERHPAYEDAGRRAKGEKNLEKLLRLMNGMPICH